MSDIIALAYEAVGDLPRWPKVLKGLKRLVGADVVIQMAALASPYAMHKAIVSDAGHVIGIGDAEAAGYADLAPSSPIALTLARTAPGLVTPVYEIMPRREFERSDFFDRWVRPNHMGDALIGPLSPIGPTMSIINFMRAKSDALTPYSDDGPAFRDVMSHISRAWRLNLRLAAAGLEVNGLSAAVLNAVSVALVCLSETGQVLWMNAAASSLLAGGDGLRLERDKRLTASMPTCAPALDLLLVEATAGRGAAVRVHRPSGRMALNLTSAPAGVGRSDDPSAALGLARFAAAVVAIHEPDKAATSEQQRAAQDRLKALFGLTEAESLVAVMLPYARTLHLLALALGVSHSTVHTHLRRVFQKMDIGSQGALLLALERLLLLA